MIDVQLEPTVKKFLQVRITAPHTEQAELLAKNLPSSQYIGQAQCYMMPIHEFLIFKDQLEALAKINSVYIQDRTISRIARIAVEQYEAQIDFQEKLKNGVYFDFSDWDISKVPGAHIEPYQGQWVGSYFLAMRERTGIFDNMGLGKSKSMLTTFLIWRKQGVAKNLLVICPNTIKPVWRDQILEHTDLTYEIIGNGSETVIAGLQDYLKAVRQKKNAEVLIIHYDALTGRKNKKTGIDTGEEIRLLLAQIPFSAVFLDEVHSLKNESGRRDAVLAVLKSIKRPPQQTLQRITLEDEAGNTIDTVINADSIRLQLGQEIDLRQFGYPVI